MFKTTLDIQEASSCNELSFILIVASVSTLKTDIEIDDELVYSHYMAACCKFFELSVRILEIKVYRSLNC